MTAIPAEIVVDASALVRGLHGASEEAAAVVDGVFAGSICAHAPDLIVPETANAALRLVRAGRFAESTATALLDVAMSPRLVRHSSVELVETALVLALETGLSAYDALYGVLARALDAPLVTADRKLASALPNTRLVL